MKDSFLTVSYKLGYIHSCYNRDTGKFEYTAQYNGIKHCKSELACKQWITKQSKEL